MFSKASTCRDGHRNYCKECQSLKKKEWYHDNKDHVLQKTKEWHQKHPEKIRNTKRKWALNNPEYGYEYSKQWRMDNPERSRAAVSARRKRVQQNTPRWADKKAIREFYEHCPKGFHVDHIIPLRGKEVSGFHIIGNLQYLPASENMSKGNKLAIY